jgi:phosphopantothenoylcysteine decarboxylase/phosphopantothenate--cysteine ligase
LKKEENKLNIIVGVTSGIAIYKAVDLVSKLRKNKFEIDIIMTENATKMISPVVFSAVGNCPVYTDTFNVKNGWIIHTELSKKADLFVLAPATANTIAKISSGVADNLLTTTILALPEKTPKILIPTMNTRMYENKLTQENFEKLKNLGWFIVEPDSGHLACGDVGKGRYPENEKIIEAIYYMLEEKRLSGKKVLVTAGPTREEIDPIRYISNYSSGKMGYEIAKISKRMGAYTTLISGPTNLTPPYFIDEFIKIKTAHEMYTQVMNKFIDYDIIIMTAAVADYTPKVKSKEKIKKSENNFILELERTKDILKELGRKKRSNQIIVGFAAETSNIIEYGKQKLFSKNADYIIANDANKVMGSDFSSAFLISKDKVIQLEGSKEKVAKDILTNIINN